MGQLIVIVVFCCRIHLLLVLFLCHLKILTLWRQRWNPIAIMSAWHYIKLHQTTSHEITSCHATSYHTMGGGGGTMPHHITTNFIISHHAPEHDTKPPDITSHVPQNITSHLTTPYKISPHHILWHHATPHHITSYHITSHEITSYHATSDDLTSHVPHHITSHHVTSLDIIPLYTKSHHITSDEDFITSLVITPYLIISKICKPVLSINFTESQKLLMWMGG